VSRTIRRIFLIATALLSPGSMLSGFALVGFPEASWPRLLLGTLGGLMVVAGPAVALVGLRRVMGQDDYLALRTDGLQYHVGDEHRLIAWDEVAEISLAPSGALAVSTKDGGPP